MSQVKPGNYSLKTKQGGLVEVRSFVEGERLCCVDSQTTTTSVKIFERFRNKKIHMAFNFQSDNNYYYLKVDGTSLKLDKTTSTNHGAILSENHWFEKTVTGGGDHYGLRSVVNPTQYLWKISNETSNFILGLTENDDDCVEVTHEEIKSSSTD